MPNAFEVTQQAPIWSSCLCYIWKELHSATVFHRGSFRAGSRPVPNLEPVFPVSTDIEPALCLRKKRLQSGTRSLLREKEQTARVRGRRRCYRDQNEKKKGTSMQNMDVKKQQGLSRRQIVSSPCDPWHRHKTSSRELRTRTEVHCDSLVSELRA